MKKIIASLGLVLASGFISAQELPKLSPLSKSEHVVGLSKITLQYSRPSVRGRVIFGDLLPYGEIWRLGANENTKITTTQDLFFGAEKNQVLPVGTYSIFAFPSEDLNWKIVFNTNTEQWGTGDYDEAKNVVTLSVKAETSAHTETLLIDINDVTTTSASLVIAWDKLKVVIPFTVETDKTAQANIDAAIAEGKDLDKVYANAANYYFNAKKDYEKALEYVNLSIGVKQAHGNTFLKARILHAKGDTKEAIKLAEEAKKMAEAAEDKRWIEYIGGTLEEWKKK
jgi:tetratricopeptide (TPR) repeat protein